MSAPRRFDGVDVTDHVRDSDIGCRKLLDVTILGGQIGDMGAIALLGDQVAATPADRQVGIVVDLAPGDIRRHFIQQACEQTDDSRLGLTAESEQDEVVPREHRVDQLRDHRIFIADNSREQRLTPLQLADQIVSTFVLDAARREAVLGKLTLAQRAQCLRKLLWNNGHDQSSRPSGIVALQRERDRDDSWTSKRASMSFSNVENRSSPPATMNPIAANVQENSQQRRECRRSKGRTSSLQWNSIIASEPLPRFGLLRIENEFAA